MPNSSSDRKIRPFGLRCRPSDPWARFETCPVLAYCVSCSLCFSSTLPFLIRLSRLPPFFRFCELKYLIYWKFSYTFLLYYWHSICRYSSPTYPGHSVIRCITVLSIPHLSHSGLSSKSIRYLCIFRFACTVNICVNILISPLLWFSFLLLRLCLTCGNISLVCLQSVLLPESDVFFFPLL